LKYNNMKKDNELIKDIKAVLGDSYGEPVVCLPGGKIRTKGQEVYFIVCAELTKQLHDLEDRFNEIEKREDAVENAKYAIGDILKNLEHLKIINKKI